MSASTTADVSGSIIDEILQLYNPAKGRVSCVGFAPSQKRRCQNVIAAHNHDFAKGIARGLPQLVHNRTDLWAALQQLARLSLCKRWHQDQDIATAENWYRTILQEANSQSTTSAPSPSTMTPPSSRQQTYGSVPRVTVTQTATQTTVYEPNSPPMTQHSTTRSVSYLPQVRRNPWGNPTPRSSPTPTVTVPLGQRIAQTPSQPLAITQPTQTALATADAQQAIDALAHQLASVQATLSALQTAYTSPALPTLPSPDNGIDGSVALTPVIQSGAVSPQPGISRVETIAEIHPQTLPTPPPVQEVHTHEAEAGDETDTTESAGCEICYLPYTDPVRTPCGHKFCRECISSWLVSHSTCPYDRRPLRVEQLETVETTCAICFQEFETPCRTPCGHTFCRECITTWLRGRPRRTCPMDRRPLRLGDLVDVNE